jgi:short-chain fatty acids transporter
MPKDVNAGVQPPATIPASGSAGVLRSVTRLCVRYAERYLPDPFLYCAILTVVVAAAALALTPSGPIKVVEAWYGGIWTILTFAMQMALVLATGVTLADAPAIKVVLRKLAALPSHQTGAAITVFLCAAIGSWLNWGFGLVVGALVAREIAKRLRDVDFGFLVAAAYMGFMTWASGLVELDRAHDRHARQRSQSRREIHRQDGRPRYDHLHLVQPAPGRPAGRPDADHPALHGAGGQGHEEGRSAAAGGAGEPTAGERTFATVLNNSWIVTVLLVAMGAVYAWHNIATNGFSLDINAFIFYAAMLGLLLHWRPIRYVHSFMAAAKTVGGILLQFPLYGGIMGMITATGLATLMAQWFVSFSTERTLAFWSFIGSNLITLFVPSGGGHWAVQGPFMIPAALKLGANPSMVAMAVAMGEQTANMLQPFWALPILAIAGLGIKGHHGLLRDRADRRIDAVRRLAPDLRLTVSSTTSTRKEMS